MKPVITLCVLIALAGCYGAEDDYTALSLTPDGDHFVATGTIDGTTPTCSVMLSKQTQTSK